MKKIIGFIIVLLLALIGVATYSYFTAFYTVAFIVDGTARKEKIKKNSSIDDIAIPQKAGYKFLYWMDDNTIVDSSYIVKDNAILVALFEKVKEVKKYTIKFDTDGGSEIKDTIVVENEKLKEPVQPTKEGYIFKEWLLDDNIYDFDTVVTKNLTLKASYLKESVKTFTVRFNTDGGSYISNKIVEQNGKVGKPSNPIKQGYHFKYWSLDGKEFNFNNSITNDLTLKAIYEKDQRKTYTVSFDSVGGNEIYSQTIIDGEKAIKPSSPVKSGYVFANWLLDSDIYDFDTPVTKSITLKAVYKKMDEEASKNSFVITFNTNGGNSIDYQLVEENGKVTKPNDPVKEGYTFKEWKVNGKVYDFDTPVTSEFSLFAEYEKNYVAATDLTLSKSKVELEVGKTEKLVATISPSDTDDTITWNTSDESVATVKNGLVTALKAGKITITATINGITKECEVSVISPVVYSYEIIENVLYIKGSDNEKYSGTLTINYSDETSENVSVLKTGYILSEKEISFITNIKVQ